jgi:hypothetical protein
MRIVPIKKAAVVLFLLIAAATGGFLLGRHNFSRAEPAVFYSLDKRANDQEIINVIDGAKKYVYFAVYTFTKENIADALIAAKQKGIDVRGITDAEESQTAYEQPIVKKLETAGIPVETQKHADGIMHIKAVVTDRAYAMGSYNWTESATVANDELLEVGTDDALRGVYASIIKNILTVNQGGGSEQSGTGQGAESGDGMDNEDGDGEEGTSAAASGKTYSYTDAAQHIGETAMVEGTPIDVYTSSGGMVFFDYCKNYKSCPFGAVIFASDASKFKDIAAYQGKEISVSGVIKSYGGKAEIAIQDPEQIQVSGGDD